MKVSFLSSIPGTSANHANGQDTKPTITVSAGHMVPNQSSSMGGQQLIDFLPSLEDYTPTVSNFNISKV